MRTHRILLVVALIALVALSAAPAAAEPLDLTAGTMQLGGSLSFVSNIYLPDEGDSQTMYLLSVQPTFSAFVVKGLEIGGGLGAQAWFGDNSEYMSTSINLFVLVRYVIDTKSIVSPFFGGRFGVAISIPDEESNADTGYGVAVSLPMGVLLALNKRVAISLGLSVDVTAWMSGSMEDTVVVSVPVGYLGVEAFF
jgi:hypothetical protein